ncbi:MAG TPA: iron-sulfur cluster assembly scaffold protein, partial [Dehalococcoidia bacterium]|jgi:nitrogen fixation NifU-like protein
MAEEAYSDTVLDHFQHPRNAGTLDHPDAVGVTTNPVCGDTMKLMLRIEDGVIREARWQTVGCPAAIATSSIATEMIVGKDLAGVEQLTREQIAAAAGGLPPSKLHCSVLAQDALRKAIRAYRGRATA